MHTEPVQAKKQQDTWLSTRAMQLSEAVHKQKLPNLAGRVGAGMEASNITHHRVCCLEHPMTPEDTAARRQQHTAAQQNTETLAGIPLKIEILGCNSGASPPSTVLDDSMKLDL